MAESNQWTMGDGTDERFAWLNSDEGLNVACVERLKGDPDIAAILEGEGGNPYFTTDAEWLGMIDLIAAAPEMLAVLKESLTVEFSDRREVNEYIAGVQAVLAKAEPPRKVKQRVSVFVTVEVEADAGAHAEAIRLQALENLHVTGVNGVVVKAKSAWLVTKNRQKETA